MLYTVRHRTTFDYEEMVSVSHHVLHLTPRPSRKQDCLRSAVEIDPVPTLNSAGQDYFGNPVQHLTINEPHNRFVAEASSLVDVFSDAASLDITLGPSWEEIAQSMVSPTGDALDAFQYTFDTPYVVGNGNGDIRAFAIESFPPGRPLLQAAMDLTTRIFQQFEYRGGVSDVSTPVADVLEMRQGVCQDFTHLQIACLRCLGLPARYVSGYLLTHAPAGQPKLVGSDASHAWLSVWSGPSGWVDFDPTNNLIPGIEHITVGWGRDYGDVSPINGFIVGGGAHKISVAVDVSAAPTDSR
jgi:transglutaminase-like putative cysteine protease